MTNSTLSIERSPFAVYQSHLQEGELAFQVRPDGSAVFFPRVVAPVTGETGLDWCISLGLGTVYSTTVVHRRNEEPLIVCLIDMDEGFRLMSRVTDVLPDEVRIGLRVKLHVEIDDDLPLPLFAPLSTADGSGR